MITNASFCLAIVTEVGRLLQQRVNRVIYGFDERAGEADAWHCRQANGRRPATSERIHQRRHQGHASHRPQSDVRTLPPKDELAATS